MPIRQVPTWEQGTAWGYDLTNAGFQTALEFLNRQDLAQLPERWIELGNGVRASVQRYTTQPEETLRFETHEKFFDVQYLVAGEERIGVAARDGLEVQTPYDVENDVTFYQEPAESDSVLLHAGEYAVFAPQDAHKPRCAAGKPMPVQKIVVKVPV